MFWKGRATQKNSSANFFKIQFLFAECAFKDATRMILFREQTKTKSHSRINTACSLLLPPMINPEALSKTSDIQNKKNILQSKTAIKMSFETAL